MRRRRGGWQKSPWMAHAVELWQADRFIERFEPE
jgi:hypothetical protein